MFERYLELLNEKGLKNVDVSRETGIPASTFSDWKKGKSSPKQEKLQKIADFFGVQLDYLLGNTEFKTKEEMIANWDKNMNPDLPDDVKRYEEFSKRDKKDIAKTMDFMMEQLDNYEEALMFDGEPLDEESRELLKVSLENSIKTAKLLAKQKFTPNKYKK